MGNAAGTGPGSGYESWFVSARSPDERSALWLRRTVHVDRRGDRHIAAWCTTFDGAARSVKQIWRAQPEPPLVAGPTAFAGRAWMQGHQAQWDLAVTAGAAAVRPLRPAIAYRLPVPRTKVEVPVPSGRLDGQVEVDGRRWRLQAWPATVGHNWGAEHAERWLWLHAFDVGPFRWVELVAARIRLAGRLLPWTATGALAVGAAVHPLAGLGSRPVVRSAGPNLAELDVRLHGSVLTVSAAATAGTAAAAVTYRDPRGGTRTVVHHGIAPVRISLTDRRGRTLHHHGSCAFEAGSADGWPGITPQQLPLEPA